MMQRPERPNCCGMPEPAPRLESRIYRKFRELIMLAHCADKRPTHKCAGKITIDRTTITLNCPRCGDLRQIIEKASDHEL